MNRLLYYSIASIIVLLMVNYFAEAQEVCMECHDDPDLIVIENGVNVSLHANQNIIDRSVHEGFLCIDCHTSLDGYEDFPHEEKLPEVSCSNCHEDAVDNYNSSVHNLSRLQGNKKAASCSDCHRKHDILATDDINSPTNHVNIPITCGKCHTNEMVITEDFVRLPISLDSYSKSVHGTGWKEGKQTAVCNDCHGSHNIQQSFINSSMVNKLNISNTCGNCHKETAQIYDDSIHGRAIKHGLTDSPSCTDCHDEHLIFKKEDERSAVTSEHQISSTCSKCHEDPEMAARYGLPAESILGYKDSYHAWAVKKGSEEAANCADCHTVHDIRSRLDPASSTHPDNVVETCRKCHENANVSFAAGYSHLFARDKTQIHDIVRVIYIILIILVLGGMTIHNIIIYVHDLKRHYYKIHMNPTVIRMNRNEIFQHLVLIISFSGLAVTGFALRFPDAWWAQILADTGMNEIARRYSHRVFAVIMTIESIYHILYLSFTKRGRILIREILPRLEDFILFRQNMSFYLGRSRDLPLFRKFDYAAKAEYWALIWGTIIMFITGMVLWFPALVSSNMPSWLIRVSEVVHFYEAILAVSAIIIWHLFFVVIRTNVYPLNWVWITGKMPLSEWKHEHPKDNIQ